MNSTQSGAVIDPAHEDEQGGHLPGPKPVISGLAPAAPVQSPLDLSNADDIISASGLGSQRNLNKQQFKPEMPGEPEEGAAEGAEGATAGLGELAPLAAL
jgi:hypothetical protein